MVSGQFVPSQTTDAATSLQLEEMLPLSLGDPNLGSMPSMSSAPLATTPKLQSNAPVIDPRPNPQYVSHMPPIFTDQYRREQELHEKNHVIKAERQWCAKLSKQGIVVYAWTKVCFC
jgi:hypothetical protein